jgi:lipopolysaccharide/colanic/teichoic acid biosynthesis glycosyltransferase
VRLLIITAVIVPMLVNEFTDWLPWFASRMIRAAARSMPPGLRGRYVEEWQAELEAVPGGNLSKLVFAIRVCAHAPSTGAALRGLASSRSIVIKSAFDRIIAAAALVLLGPLMMAIAVAIKFTDQGPVFFRQTRVGKDGQIFPIWKFRTMVVDAEQGKAELAAHNEADGALYKMGTDPRVTTAGVWLRRWSLDELPQLYNVLFGDMSLVGPRPALPAEAARYDDQTRRRLVVKPGLTGLWQVSGRSDLSWDEAVTLDLRYVKHRSFALDLQILWKTWAVLVRGSGRY